MSSLKPNAQIMCMLSASCIYMRHIHIHLWVWYISVCTNSILRNQDQQTSFRECIALGLGLPLLTLKGKVIKDRSWLTDRMTCLSVGDQLCQPLYCQNKFMSLTKCNIFFCFTSGWLKMFLFTYMCKNLAVYYHFIMWRSIIQIHTMHMHGAQWCECADSTKHQAWHRTWKLLLRYSLSPRHGHGDLCSIRISNVILSTIFNSWVWGDLTWLSWLKSIWILENGWTMNKSTTLNDPQQIGIGFV